MRRRHLLAAIVLIVFCAIMPGDVLAVVGLVRFEATAQPENGRILLVWETASEMNTTGFALYRAESASPGSWGDPIHTTSARGDTFTGAIYEYGDSTVTAGVRYYYQLEELTSSGTPVVLGQRSAGIDLPADTPTGTPTPTATATRTATSNPTAVSGVPTVGIVLTNTPPPTATQQFTNTPVSGPSPTPPPGIQPTAPPVVRPAATPLPAAAVNTPTGAPEAPATLLPEMTAPPPAEAPALASTALATAAPLAGLATATPRPAREGTPVIFESSAGRATPDAGSQGAAQGSRNTGLAWVIGGSLIGLAGLLGVILLYVRSRRA